MTTEFYGYCPDSPTLWSTISLQELTGRYAAGELKPSDIAWHPELKGWMPLREVLRVVGAPAPANDRVIDGEILRKLRRSAPVGFRRTELLPHDESPRSLLLRPPRLAVAADPVCRDAAARRARDPRRGQQVFQFADEDLRHSVLSPPLRSVSGNPCRLFRDAKISRHDDRHRHGQNDAEGGMKP